MSSGSQSYIALFPVDPANPSEIPSSEIGEKINFAAETLTAGIGTSESKHIRADRMTSDLVITDREISGGFENELHFEQDQDDKLIASVLWGEWQGILADGTTSIDAEGAVIDDVAHTIDFSGCPIQPDNLNHPGVRVRIQGAVDSQLNTIFQLTATGTANVYEMDPLPNSAETLPAGATADTQYVKNGSIYSPWFIERGHVDVDQYFQFMGMAANTWTLTLPESDVITNEWGFVGLLADIVQSPTFGGGYTTESTAPSMSAANNVKQVEIDNVPIEGCLLNNWTMEINNNVTGNKSPGTQGACRTTPHKFQLSGTLTMYFENEEMFNRLQNGTEFSFAIDFIGNNGNEYEIVLPRCKVSEDPINVTSAEDDVFDNAGYVALADNATGAQIIIYKFPKNVT